MTPKRLPMQCKFFCVTFYTALYIILYAKPDSVFGADNVSEDKIDSDKRQE